jgi:hypothetical protein
MSVIVKEAGKQITLSEGAALTAKYRASHPTWIKGHLIGKDRFNEILSQSGCDGIRIYYGENTDGSRELVLVGVDSSGNDLTNGIIIDRAVKCPPFCSVSNPLNG